jgi:hypothetical protein
MENFSHDGGPQKSGKFNIHAQTPATRPQFSAKSNPVNVRGTPKRLCSLKLISPTGNGCPIPLDSVTIQFNHG